MSTGCRTTRGGFLRSGVSGAYQYYYNLKERGRCLVAARKTQTDALVREEGDSSVGNAACQVSVTAPYVITAVALFLLGRKAAVRWHQIQTVDTLRPHEASLTLHIITTLMVQQF